MVGASKAANISLTLVLTKQGKLNYSKILGRSIKHDRSSITLKETKERLTISIKAKDTTALRASTNSILRDLQVIESTKL